jgi:hypothetical protein
MSSSSSFTTTPSKGKANAGGEDDGFVRRKRAVMLDAQNERESKCALRKTVPLDFVFENPLHGKLWDTTCMQKLRTECQYTVYFERTSYCQYDFEYMKPTGFLTSLPELTLKPPCRNEHPCWWMQRYKKHPTAVLSCSQAQRNSVPTKLVDAIVIAWIKRTRWATKRLFIDVFSGFGSVEEAVRERGDGIHVYSNEWVRGRGQSIDLDMRLFDLTSLLMFAIQRTFRDIDGHLDPPMKGGGSTEDIIEWLKQEKTAVLFHVSTPCETYSSAAGVSHRARGGARPVSPKAREHDYMNATLVAWFRKHVLEVVPPPPPPAPPLPPVPPAQAKLPRPRPRAAAAPSCPPPPSVTRDR